MQKQMTYGDGQALMVLAAERMGLSLRWSRSFGQSPGRNKLRPVPGIWF